MSDENKTVKLSDKDKKYWSNRIDSEVSDKRQELKRAIELKVDKQIKKEYKKFVSTLKLASKLTALKKASKEYDDFVRLKEIKERELRDKQKKLARDVDDVYNRQAKIHGWTGTYSGQNECYEDFDRFLINMPRPASPSLIKLYESKSIEGLLLDHREVKPLAVNDWQLIQKILINQKNN
jgi:hypothetical protein